MLHHIYKVGGDDPQQPQQQQTTKLALQAVQTHTDIKAPDSTLIYFNDIISFKDEGSRKRMFHVRGHIVTWQRAVRKEDLSA